MKRNIEAVEGPGSKSFGKEEVLCWWLFKMFPPHASILLTMVFVLEVSFISWHISCSIMNAYYANPSVRPLHIFTMLSPCIFFCGVNNVIFIFTIVMITDSDPFGYFTIGQWIKNWSLNISAKLFDIHFFQTSSDNFVFYVLTS